MEFSRRFATIGVMLFAVVSGFFFNENAWSQQPQGNPSNSRTPALINGPGSVVQSPNSAPPNSSATSSPGPASGPRGVEYRIQDGNVNLPQPDPRWRTTSQVQPASFTESLPTQSTQLPTNSSSTASGKKSRLSSIRLDPSSSESSGELKKPSNSISSFLGVVFSMGIVLSLFLGLAWVYKKSMPKSMGRLPNEVVQVLGRTNLSPRQQMYVVRFGKKLLLVSQQPGQTQTLSEISEDEEVDRLTGICQSHLPTSATQSFSDVLRQVASGQRTSERRRTRSA